MDATIRTPITADLLTGGPTVDVDIAASWDPADPAAVVFSFRAGYTKRVVWTFARALLREGLAVTDPDQPAGHGDVLIGPDDDPDRDEPSVCLALSSPSGHAVFRIPRRPLDDLLAGAARVVPEHAEHLVITTAIDTLLSELATRDAA